MRCERALELLSDYCEGSLPGAMRVTLESHLEGCARCRDEVSDLRHVWSVLDSAPLVAAPVGLRATVWQRIDSAGKANNGSWAQNLLHDWKESFGRRPLAWAGAMALMIVFASAAVPGSYSRALLFGQFGRDSRAQFVAARPQVSPGGNFEIRLHLADADGKVLRRSVPVQVRVLGGPVSLSGPSTLTCDGAAPAVILLNRASDAASSPVILEAKRLDGGEPSTQILHIPLPAR